MSLVVASKTLLRCQFEIRKELQNNIRYHGTSSSSSRVCSRCGSPLHSCCAIFCPSINCSYIQPIDCGDCKCNYFELFSLDSTKFDIDIIDLENKFRNLQKRVHPDKLVSTLDNDGIDVARRNSSFINQVYQTLKHPLSRAIYMVRKLIINTMFFSNCFLIYHYLTCLQSMLYAIVIATWHSS